MYEYRTQTHYGVSLPEILVPPDPSFRLRDFRPIVTSESENVNVSDRYSSLPTAPGGVSGGFAIPYKTGGLRSRSYQWVIVWERYVPEQENE